MTFAMIIDEKTNNRKKKQPRQSQVNLDNMKTPDPNAFLTFETFADRYGDFPVLQQLVACKKIRQLQKSGSRAALKSSRKKSKSKSRREKSRVVEGPKDAKDEPEELMM